jgi:hypothetical protein
MSGLEDSLGDRPPMSTPRSLTTPSSFSDDSFTDQAASRPSVSHITTRSDVWKYFNKEVDNEGECAICTLNKSNGQPCLARRHE